MKPGQKSVKLKHFLILVITISIMAFTGSVPANSQQNTDPIGAGSILRSGVDARALAMGGAYVAVADNYSAPYWNPGGITRTEPVYLGGMNYDKFGLGLNVNYLSGGISPLRWPITKNRFPSGINVPFIQDFSLGGTYLGFSTNVRALDSELERVLITYSERAFTLTSGLRVSYLGSIGATLKNYRFRAPEIGADGGDATANGVGFDLGFLAEPLSNFFVGAAGFDISGTDINWEDTPTEPTNVAPTRYSAGAAYDLDLSLLSIPELAAGNTIFAGQYTFGQNVENEISAGMEYGVSIFALRAGVTRETSGTLEFSAGAGLKINLLSADVAWVQNSSVEGENTSDTIVLSTEFTF